MDGPESYIIYLVDSMMMIVVHAIVAHGLDGFECGGFQDIIYKRCMKGNLGDSILFLQIIKHLDHEYNSNST